MAARSIGSGTISLGLVTIPVKLYTATSAKGVSFNQLHACPGGGQSRVKQQLRCAAEDKPIEDRSELVKGLEVSTDQFAIFTAEELKTLEASRPAVLELVEFVPAKSVDPIYLEKTIFLAPDKGGAHGYALLADALRETKRVGLGTFASRSGKDVLVEVRPFEKGLALCELFYADEVRSFAELEIADVELGAREKRLARQLVTKLAAKAFVPEKYRDTWADKVLAVARQKLAGGDVVIPEAPATREQVSDLVDALERSIVASGPRKAVPRRGARAA